MNDETLKEYKAYLWKRWALDVAVRTIKTGAETAAGMITVGALLSEIKWLQVLSVTAVAMIYTVLINIYRIASDLSKSNDLTALPFDNVEKGENSVENLARGDR